MCPSEIVVLDIEVLLARASIVIIADGSVFARNNIVGKYAAILICLLLFKELRLVWIQFDRLLCSLYNKAEMPILTEIVKGKLSTSHNSLLMQAFFQERLLAKVA